MFLLLSAILIMASSASAQFKKWSELTTINAGYASLVGETTGNTLEGYAIDVTHEQVNLDGDLSGGFMIAYLSGHDEDTETDRKINYYSVPLFLQGKYFFGSDMIAGYAQGGVGIQFSGVDYVGKTLMLSDGDAGIAMMAGLGANFYTDEKIFISAAYNFSYLNNSFYRDGIFHLFKVGIGFQSN